MFTTPTPPTQHVVPIQSFLSALQQTSLYSFLPKATANQQQQFALFKQQVINLYQNIPLQQINSFKFGNATIDCLPFKLQPALKTANKKQKQLAWQIYKKQFYQHKYSTLKNCPYGKIPLDRTDPILLAKQGLFHFRQKTMPPLMQLNNTSPKACTEQGKSDQATYCWVTTPELTVSSWQSWILAEDAANPTLGHPTASQHSIGQMWITTSPTWIEMDTLETGWIKAPWTGQSTNNSVLFSFSGIDNYTGFECYDGRCGDFVFLTSSAIFDQALVPNGQSKQPITLKYQKASLGYQLTLNNTAVGYYPYSNYANSRAGQTGFTLGSAGGEAALATSLFPAYQVPMGTGVIPSNSHYESATSLYLAYCTNSACKHPYSFSPPILATEYGNYRAYANSAWPAKLYFGGPIESNKKRR